MRTSITFTNCPECGVNIGIQGLASHRRRHGITTEPVRRTASKRLTKEERRAQLEARLAAIAANAISE